MVSAACTISDATTMEENIVVKQAVDWLCKE